jgi:uncharacterized protein
MPLPKFNPFNNAQATFDRSKLGILVVAIFGPFLVYQVDPDTLFDNKPTKANELPVGAQAMVGERAIKLEVSRSPATHTVGLTFRPDIPVDRGYLYLKGKNEPLQFSGRNMLFATDLIFLHEQRVVMVHTGIAPCQEKCPVYTSNQKFDGAIEVKSGIVEGLGIHIGMEIPIGYRRAGT